MINKKIELIQNIDDEILQTCEIGDCQEWSDFFYNSKKYGLIGFCKKHIPKNSIVVSQLGMKRILKED